MKTGKFDLSRIEGVRLYNTKCWTLQTILGIAIVVLNSINASAVNYYVSSKSGNDSNNGKSKSTPWKTVNKVNSSMSLFAAGDSILFERSSIFYGSLVITKSGAVASYLNFGAYGSGASPVIKGSKEVTGWSTFKINVWQATFTNCPDSLTNLFVNDAVQPIGREPNSGYYRITNTTGSKIRDAAVSLPSTDYYKGAQVAVKVIKYIINKWKVTTSSTNGTITTDRSGSFETDHGFFIMNHVNTLDQQGEWSFDKANNKIYLYSTTDPSAQTVEVDFNRYGLVINKQKYVSVSGIEFTRHKIYGMWVTSSQYINLHDNTISYSGANGIRVSEANFITFQNNTVTNSNNNGIEWCTVRDGLIKGNTIRKSAMIPGKGWNDNEQNCAIILFRSSYGDIRGGSRNKVLNNVIDSSGYNGISMLWNDTVLIQNNYITNSMLTLDDGGAIYYVRDAAEPKQRENKIIGNIIDYSFGNRDGTPDGYSPYWENQDGEGIYLDNRACYALVQDNVVTRTCKGIFIHNGEYNVLRNNIIFKCSTSTLYLKEDNGNIDFLYNNRIVKNKTYSDVEEGTEGKYTMYVIQESGTFDNTNVIDSNYYASPFYKQTMFEYLYYNPNGTGSGGEYNLTEWQRERKFDWHSYDEPISIEKSQSTKEDYAILVYNSGVTSKNVTLNGKYLGFTGKTYTNTITLEPFSGKILFKDSRIDGTSDTTDVQDKINFRWNTEYFNYYPDADIIIYDVQGRLISNIKGSEYSPEKVKSNLIEKEIYIYSVDLKNNEPPINGKLVISNLF